VSTLLKIRVGHEAFDLVLLLDRMRNDGRLQTAIASTAGDAHGHLLAVQLLLGEVARLLLRDPDSSINMAHIAFAAKVSIRDLKRRARDHDDNCNCELCR